MKTLRVHTNKFTNLCKPSPTIFLDKLTLNVLNILRKGSLEDAAASVEKHMSSFQDVQKEVASLESDILTLAGFGQKTEALRDTLHQVNLMINSLEELYCASYDGYEALDQAYHSHGLSFQKR